MAWTVPVASNLRDCSEVWKEQDLRDDDKEVWGKECELSLGMDTEYEHIEFSCEDSSKLPTPVETFESKYTKLL